jgi:hypothetical protein
VNIRKVVLLIAGIYCLVGGKNSEVRILKTVVRLCRNYELNWYWVFICAAMLALLVVSVLNEGHINDFTIYLFFSVLFFIMIVYQGFEIVRD